MVSDIEPTQHTMIFKRQTITALIDDQIYIVKRALVDSAAKADFAKSQVAAAQATITYHQARLVTLESQRSSLGEAVAA